MREPNPPSLVELADNSSLTQGIGKWQNSPGASPVKLIRTNRVTQLAATFNLLAQRHVGFSQKLNHATEVILEVKAGEGGDDSKLFVRNLFAGLSRYAVRHRLKVSVLASINGHLVAKVTGKNVWKILQPQIGTHCVQRIPPTETRGRRHTSYLVVAAFPIIEQAFKPLPPSEVEIKTQRGHGPGGQHQNKTDSAVRMTHVPTGIKVFINGRDQWSNKIEALKILTARVRDHQQQSKDEEYRNIRKFLMGSAGRGNKIRTYNYLNDRAVDHRTGAKTKIRPVIEKGEFERLD